MLKTYPSIGLQIPAVLLPRPDIDLPKWAVVACDQFTSQPDYWQAVEHLVGAAPSTCHLTLPEIYLGAPDEPRRIESIHRHMQAYWEQHLLHLYQGMVYVERSFGSRTRHGLMVCLDLETYDYREGAQCLVHPTEATIVERVPPRLRIRENALLELPHILVLIDDEAGTVIEPVTARRDQLGRLYDFDLMLGSGHLTGYGLAEPALERQIVAALEALVAPRRFEQRYNVPADQCRLLYAVGDGNHSLATAKAAWEKLKPQAGPLHPARYALVEVVNVHDAGLEFEPIHRVLFELQHDWLAAARRFFGDRVTYRAVEGLADMTALVDQARGPAHTLGLLHAGEWGVLTIEAPAAHLAVGSVQNFVSAFMEQGGARRVDYVHGTDVVERLAAQPGNLGFYLPSMPKADLFQTVVSDGLLPLKAFSLGHAREKRFYMEARRIMS